MEDKQVNLFEVETDRENEWYGMPEYKHKYLLPKYQVIINFESTEDLKKFSELIKQPLTTKTQSVWYPEAKIGTIADKRFIDEP